jgi:ParB family chromosome partitioning protein
MELHKIRCDEIRTDPRSRGYSQAELLPLAESVRMYGILRPVMLRETERGYVIVHGERRWRAAQMAGLVEIPSLVVQDLRTDVAA